MKLSCLLIVRNEEELLPRCLDSLRYEPVSGGGQRPLWDELVIVDTGSTDRTIEIASAYGARVEIFDWTDDFSAARNFAEAVCTGDYVYWQDADEVLIAGHELIRAIVDANIAAGIRPEMILSRDEYGAPNMSYPRQELLHKRGAYIWRGAVHEWTEATGPWGIGRFERGIQIEQAQRAGGDRPHADIFGALRQNLLRFQSERHYFYLAREHFYAQHYHEAIALVDAMLGCAAEWPIQRSHAAIIQGDCYKALGRHREARAAYLRAVQEWGAWAEPYYALGLLHYELEQWAEGASWFAASLPFAPATEYFLDESIYIWRRYDLLAVCLGRIGMMAEARLYGERAWAARPNDTRLLANLEWYTTNLT